MFMADSPDFVARLPGRDADRRGPGAGVDHAARATGWPSCCATRGPGCWRSAPSSPSSPRRPPRTRPELTGVRRRPGRRRPAAGIAASHRSTTSPTSDGPMRRLPDDGRTRRRSGSTPPARPARRRRAMHRHGVDPVGLRDVRRAGARASARRPLPVGGQGVLRLRPRQLRAVPAVGRRGRGARAGAVAAGRRSPSARREYGATLFFAGPTFFANMLRADLPADALGRRAAGRVGGRGAAGRALPALDRALRRRHPRRHRHDRDAAHLPVQPRPARSGPARPASPYPATTCASSTTTGARRRRPATPGTLLVRGDVDGHRLLVAATTAVPPGVPGRVAAHRRHVRAATRTATTAASAAPATCSRPAGSGCRRPRSRTGCWPTTRSRRRSWSPRADARRPGEAGRVRRPAPRARARPRTS